MNFLFRIFVFLALLPMAAISEVNYRQIQGDLNRMGYKVGTADGIPGRNTRRGIRQFFNDAGFEAPAEVTLKEQDFIHDVANFTDKPLSFIRDVITHERKIKDLSDEEICELNFHIDLMPVYYELQKRNLNCPSGTEKVIVYDGTLINDPIVQLRDFEAKFNIAIPTFNLEAAQTFTSWKKTKETYEYLNPLISQLVDQEPERLEYCGEFMKNIGSVPPDPSKNLDGTGSWAENTMRDSLVICQDSLNALYLRALSSDELLAERSRLSFQNLIETIVARGGANNLPFRAYHKQHNSRTGRADPNFTYLITISKLMAGVELLHSTFDWSKAEYAEYAAWARDRIMQRLPVGGRSDILKGGICDLDPTIDQMNDACMNAAPYVAQGLLRAAIMGNDHELAELSYLVFKQYTSSIRPDGSQAHDSIRDCYAADYTIWASEFLHDYVYLAAQAGVDLWTHRFSDERGTPADNLRYALQVRENPNLVNKYALDIGFPDCEEQDGEIVQRTEEYPWSAFAFYLYQFEPKLFDNILLEDRSDIWSYTGASGVNYEVDFLIKNPEIVEYFWANEGRILDERAEAEQKLREAKREEKLLKFGFQPITGDDPFAGKYRVKWYFKNVNDAGSEREYQSTDTLTLEGGLGKFSGDQKYSQPSAGLRKDLFVAYTLSGKIYLSGDLDLFDAGRAYPTELTGSLNIQSTPEITGVWEEGDVFELELERLN